MRSCFRTLSAVLVLVSVQLIVVLVYQNQSEIANAYVGQRFTKITNAIAGENHPLQCQEIGNGNDVGIQVECCAPWEANTDDWWLHHPDWEVSTENETSYCFAPMKGEDSEKAAYLRELHEFQWVTGNCSEVVKSCEVNAGYGASIAWLSKAFWYASQRNKPFQILLNGRRWLYSTDNNSSWAYCKDRDTRCYYLPISPCSREVVGDRNEHHAEKMPRGSVSNQSLQFHWMKQYLLRPRQILRQKRFEIISQLNLSFPCTTMHVRRGDVGRGGRPHRRFAHVQEYLDAGNITEGETIVLLTDADSTIQEIKTRHTQYNWIYLDRPRHMPGIVRNDMFVPVEIMLEDHIPSGDEGWELLAIETEIEIASSCHKVVTGQSGFATNLMNDMSQNSIDFTQYVVSTGISPEAARKFNYSAFEQEIYARDTYLMR